MTPQEAVAAATKPEATQTVEEKLATLQEKFTKLEERFNSLQEQAFTTKGESNGDVPEVSVVQATPTTDAAPEGSEPPGVKDELSTSRARVLINRADPETGERKDHLPNDPPPKTPVVRERTQAFTLRKNLYDVTDDNDGEIAIVSQDLWDLLGQILKYYPNHLFTGPLMTLTSPYEELILNWEKLEEAAKKDSTNEKDRQARSDLRLLLDAIAAGSGDPKLDKFFKTRQSNREQKVVSFESLWTLFPRGTLVYGRPFLGQDQIFLVYDNLSPWPRRAGRPWALICWAYDWDGKSFKRLPLRLEFEHFDAPKPITTLPYYPLEFHEKPEEIKERLIARGEKYREYCTAKQGSRMFDYSGEAIFAKRGFSRLDDGTEDDARSFLDNQEEPTGTGVKPSKLDSNARVMVDFESYFRYGPADASRKRSSEVGYRQRFDREKAQNKTWEDEQTILCPPRVLGYVLSEKQWAQLQVTELADIPPVDPSDSWTTRLQLADGNATKSLILNLVKSHKPSGLIRDEEALEVDDIVAKKGLGLVILLYGPPGVGKTSTAETVAIATRKPLFSISVADVGTKAKNVEANLAKIFALATSWQAILLLDEADVFLERRGGNKGSTDSNALVSVLLRVLEYYQGILILTTNQIAQFDVAVQSRIHIAIKYDHLNKDQTMAIFKGFLDPMANRDLVEDWEGIQTWLSDDVCGEGLDGRQIRNIVTSALGLARAEKRQRLTQQHIKKVLTNTKKFKGDFWSQYEKYKNEQMGMVR